MQRPVPAACRDYVKPDQLVGPLRMPLNVGFRGASDALLLTPANGGQCRRLLLPMFDFDKDQEVTTNSNNVDLAHFGDVSACQNSEAFEA